MFLNSKKLNRLSAAILLGLFIMLAGGCVFYNTFFNARQAFNEAEKTRKSSRLQGGRIKKDLYQQAIEKSLKVIENYPNSKYYDDALFVLGVSYYYTDKHFIAERRLRELLANYADSKYAPEAELYLAKAKLELKDEKDGMVIFSSIFDTDFDKAYKAEAALALGDYYFRDRDFEQSRLYYRALRDSLGTQEERRLAQRMIADSYFESYQFQEALGGYLQLMGMDPDKNETYHAYYNAALCSFSLMKIETGRDYLRVLSENETYFDSLSVIRLRVAEGYEYEEDIEQAEEIYRSVLEQESKMVVAAEAAYRLGLIYQFEYDDLPKAKLFYDRTVKLSRNSDFGRDALERSSHIGKVEEFSRTLNLDSTTTQEMIDEAAYTQYQLAELYWLNLNKPDSAMVEMQYIIDSFPASVYAPKALIALSQMYSDHKEDSIVAHQLLSDIPRIYPHSDYVPEALDALGLIGTSADTGYAKLYLDRAENFLDDSTMVDSVRFYYQYIADNFPRSKLYPQARFGLIWLTETYSSPGDSSVYYAYTDFIDSFPNSTWADEAQNRIGRVNVLDKKVEDEADTLSIWDDRDDDFPGAFGDEDEDTTKAVDPLEDVYVDPNGERISNIAIEPVEIREEFEYPVEAYRLGWEGDLYFQIFLDFSGEVVDYILKIRCESEDINREASEAVASMTFDPLRVPQEQQEAWMVYRFKVRKPEHIR